MELQHINVKLFLDQSPGLGLWDVVPVFHSWIQDQNWDELLIDVADYRHVNGGPGIVLVGHEADYSIDYDENRVGIRYNRKSIVPGTNQDRLRHAFRAAFRTCGRLEADRRLKDRFRFGRREMKLFVNDRLLVPNLESSYESIEPEIKRFLEGLLGGIEFSISREEDSKRVFGLTVMTAQDFDVKKLLERLA